MGLSVNFVNFLCGQETFHQILSTFCVARRTFVNFCQLSVMPEDFWSTFRVSRRTFVNFPQLSSTSVNFPCFQKILGQLSV